MGYSGAPWSAQSELFGLVNVWCCLFSTICFKWLSFYTTGPILNKLHRIVQWGTLCEFYISFKIPYFIIHMESLCGWKTVWTQWRLRSTGSIRSALMKKWYIKKICTWYAYNKYFNNLFARAKIAQAVLVQARGSVSHQILMLKIRRSYVSFYVQHQSF